MTRLGADPDDLRRLAAALRRTAGEFDGIAARTGHRLRTTPWQGRDALRVRADWERRQRRSLVAGAAACRSAAAGLDRQVVEQLQAATAAGATAASPALAPATRGRPGADPFGPLPTTSTTVSGSAGLGAAGVTVGPAGSVTVERLPGGTDRVVVAEELDVGIGGGVGRSAAVSVDGTPWGTGAAASAGAMAGVVRRRSWEVPDHDVDALVRAIGLTALARATPATGLADRLRPAVFGPATVDRPDRTERLLAVEGRASLRAAAPGHGGTAGIEAGWRAGRADGAWVVEHEGRAALATHAAVLGALGLPAAPTGGGSAHVRVEVPDDGGPLRVSLTARPGAGPSGRVDVVEAVMALRPGAAPVEPGRAVADLARAARDGTDPTAARAALGALWEPTAIRSVDVRVSTGEVAAHSLSAGGAAGVATVGVDAATATTTRREVGRMSWRR